MPEEDARTLSIQAVNLLTRLKDYSHGEAGHLLESMMDAGIADDGVVRETFDWLQTDRSHPAWPLVAGKCLLRMRDDERAWGVASDLVEAIERHPNAGAWYRLQIILETHGAKGDSQPLEAVQAALARRKLVPAWAAVNDQLQSGKPTKAIVTRQAGQTVTVELEGGLFAVLRIAEGFRHRRGQALEVVVIEISTHMDRIVVSPYPGVTAPLVTENLTPGANYEGIVKGHQPYGVFVNVRGQKGLIHAKYLTDVPSFSARFPTETKVLVRLVEVGPTGLVLALPPTQ